MKKLNVCECPYCESRPHPLCAQEPEVIGLSHDFKGDLAICSFCEDRHTPLYTKHVIVDVTPEYLAEEWERVA